MRDHRRLQAFHLADEVALLTYEMTAAFPREEIYGLMSQMRRAAVSVPSNIIEGFARESLAEYVRFLHIAFGSLRELHYQVSLARRLNILPTEKRTSYEHKIIETEKVLNGLLQSLRRQKGQGEI